MKNKKVLILRIILVFIVLASSIIAIGTDKYIIFFASLIVTFFVPGIILRVESKRINKMAKTFWDSNHYQDAIEYFKKQNSKLVYNQICLMYLVLFYMYSDNAIEAKKILESNPKIKSYPALMYPQFILAIAQDDKEKVAFYSNKVLYLKNKKFIDQQENTKKILDMLESKVINREVYEKTKIPLLKKICLKYDDNNVEIDNLHINIENIQPIKLKECKSSIKLIKVVLNIFTCCSIFFALMIIAIQLSKVEAITSLDLSYQMSKKLWIFYLFLPITIGNIAFSVYLKWNGYKYKSNLILGIIFSVVLFLYGSMHLISSRAFSTDKTYLIRIEEMIEIDFPDNFEIIINGYDDTKTALSDDIRLKYVSVVKFEEDVAIDFSDKYWTTDLTIKGLPDMFVIETMHYDYFMIYCIETKEFKPNVYMSKNNYLAIAYDMEKNNLLIYEYSIE